jgi:hypothetical protein
VVVEQGKQQRHPYALVVEWWYALKQKRRPRYLRGRNLGLFRGGGLVRSDGGESINARRKVVCVCVWESCVREAEDEWKIVCV